MNNNGDEFFQASRVLKIWLLSAVEISRGLLLKNPLELTFSSLVKLIPDKLLSSRACFRFNLTSQI